MKEYSQDLYKKENIIGYTGNIKNNPTVYFKQGNKYGHITQVHNKEANIGREIGVSSSLYRMSNSGPKGRLQESIDGEVHHTSRNPFVRPTCIEECDELAKSIDRFKELKPINAALLKSAKENALKNVTYKQPFFEVFKQTIDRLKNPYLQAVFQYEIESKNKAKYLPIRLIDEKMKKFTKTSNESLNFDLNNEKENKNNLIENNETSKKKFHNKL